MASKQDRVGHTPFTCTQLPPPTAPRPPPPGMRRSLQARLPAHAQPAGGSLGTGYPHDEATKSWLASNVDPVFGFRPIVRFGWETASRCAPARDAGAGADAGISGASRGTGKLAGRAALGKVAEASRPHDQALRVHWSCQSKLTLNAPKPRPPTAQRQDPGGALRANGLGGGRPH